MNPELGHFSLVQFCPDAARAEAINVGVILVCPERSFIDVKLETNHRRAKAAFRTMLVDLHQVQLETAALKNMISAHSGRPDEKFLRWIRASRAHTLQLSEPRPTRIDDPASDLESLFDGLVGTRTQRNFTKRTPAIPELDEGLRSPALVGRVWFSESFTVKLIGARVKADYAYQNGVLRLIQVHDFAGPSSVRKAIVPAGEGKLLTDFQTTRGKAELTVVGSMSSGPESARICDALRPLFSDFGVRFLPREEVPSLLREAESQAKPITS